MSSVEEIEQRRKQYVKTITAWWIGVLICVGTAAAFQKSSISLVFFVVAIVVAILAVVISLKGFITTEEESGLFKTVVEDVLGADVEYQPKKGFDETEVRSTDLFEYFATKKSIFEPHVEFVSEDQLIGSWQGIEFRIADAKMHYTTSNGKSTQTHIIFDGVLIKCHYPWDFDGSTWVQPKMAMYANSIGELVTLESPEFHKIYTVKSTDQVGARMALQTDIMSSMIELQNGVWLSPRYAFVGSDVWIAMPTETFGSSWLDLNMFSSITIQLADTKTRLRSVSQLMLNLKLHHIGNRITQK